MTTKPTTKDRMIAAGANLFQRRGYHGTGLIEILETSGAPKGSFYHHFPEGKEQLAEVAMQQAGGVVDSMIERAFAGSSSFAEGATLLACAIADWFERSDFAEGCPITSVLLETVPGSDRLGAVSHAIFQTWIGTAQSHAVRLGRVNEANDLATGLLIALEGAWIVARAQRSRRPFEIAAAFFAET